MTRKHDPEAVYRYIVEYKRRHDGNSPSTREIAQACSVPHGSTLRSLLEKLARARRIRLREDLGTRGIEIVGGQWVPPEEVS